METNSKKLADSWNKEIYFMKKHCIRVSKNETITGMERIVLEGKERLFVFTDNNVYEILEKHSIWRKICQMRIKLLKILRKQ